MSRRKNNEDSAAPGERWYGIIDGTLEKEYDEWEQNEDNREKVRVKGREGCSSG